MKKEDILFGDWQRWLFGEAPPSFVGETALRALFVFLFMVLIMRLMGRRMQGQMSVTELAVVRTLGAVIAGPMRISTAGLLALLFMHRFTNWLVQTAPGRAGAAGRRRAAGAAWPAGLTGYAAPGAVAGAIIWAAALRSRRGAARPAAPRVLRKAAAN
jgi:hypothetical protein